MELFFVRHGQTDYNAQKRFQGRVDVPLNQTGRRQAIRMREALCGEIDNFARIYSSPLCRATETARLITSDTSKIRIDGRLIEISLGEFDGRLEAEIETEIGEADYAAWRASNFIQPAPGGESLGEAMQRARDFLKRLDVLPQDRNVAIVSHQGMLTALKAELSGEQSRAALNRFRQKNDEIEVWNTERPSLSRRIDLSANPPPMKDAP